MDIDIDIDIDIDVDIDIDQDIDQDIDIDIDIDKDIDTDMLTNRVRAHAYECTALLCELGLSLDSAGKGISPKVLWNTHAHTRHPTTYTLTNTEQRGK